MKNRSKKEIDMLNGPLLGSVIRYTIPIILTGVLQLLFNAADLVIVGQFCGSVYVGAVGATGSLVGLFVNSFIGLSIGAGVVVAQAAGARQEEELHHAVHTALPLAAACGALLTVLGVIFAPIFLQWMGTPADVLPLSAVYMRIYFAGMIPSLVYNFGAAILRAVGDTRGPLIYLSAAGALNVVLNVFFVTVCGMDVDGVALATALSQLLSAALVVRALLKRQDACRLQWDALRIRRRPLLLMLRIGLPAAAQSSLFSISNILIQSSINSFGAVAVTGNAAASNIEGFVYQSMYAFQQTGMNMTGQNIGARNFPRVRKILHTCLLCVAVVGAGLGILVYCFAEPLLGIYITDSAEAVAFGVQRMAFTLLSYALCGILDVTTSVIRGMGYSLAPMCASVLGICAFRVVWILTVFPNHHTLPMLYVTYPISWLITMIAEYTMFWIFYRRLGRPRKTLQRRH